MDKSRHPQVIQPWKLHRQLSEKGYGAPAATHPHAQNLRRAMPRNPKHA